MQTHLTLLDKQMLLYSMVMSPRTSKEILLSIVSTVSTGSFCSSKPPIKITCAQHFGESHGVRNVCFKNCLSSHFKRASPRPCFPCCLRLLAIVPLHFLQANSIGSRKAPPTSGSLCACKTLLTSVKEQGGGGGGGGRFIQGGGRGGRGRHLFETPYDNKRKRTLRTPH
mgnify:CR=1 FL=1